MTSPEGLTLGWSRVEVTPQWPVPLAGYASREAFGPTAEVISPLLLRTVALHSGGRTVVIMVADLLWWGPDNVARVQADLAQAYGLAPEQIILSGTHTHSGPQPSDHFARGLGLQDPAWVEQLYVHAVDAVGQALANPVPVTLEVAQGEYQLGVERRFARSGGAERAAEVQPRLTVLTFRGAEGVVATVMHHACHPTIHSDNAISADFPGAATASLEANGDTEFAMYLQGCCGNINPNAYVGTLFQHGAGPEITAMGEGLAEAVRALVGRGEAITPALTWARDTVVLPTEPAPDEAELERLAGLGRLMESGWAELMLARPDRREARPLTLTKIGLGDDLQLIGLGAEVTSPYANHVTEAFGPRALTLGYCNGMLTYIVTAEQLADGGYEAEHAMYWFGMPGKFTPAVEPELYAALDAIGAAGE